MTMLITGGSGMVGRNLIHSLEKTKKYNLLFPSSSELDLLDYKSVTTYLKKHKPNIIIHCAGLVGGIHANMKKPYSFLFHNLIIGSNIIQGAIKNNIPKLINLGSSCMFPKDLDRELIEEDILTGRLEPTNEGYAIAKIATAKLCQYALKEFNMDYKTIIPCNLYGKWDKFDIDKSHMIPAVIRKIHLAKKNNQIAEIWGDGSARREFMYVEDLVDFIHFSILNYDKIETYINVGLGYDYSVLDYYKEIANIIGYESEFKFDLTKSVGMKKKLCSVKKQNKLGWKPKHSLKQGLLKTYKFYLNHYEL